MATINDSNVFIEIAENISDDVRVDYSGRGMYGRTCVGFVGGVSDLVAFVVDVTEEYAYQVERDGEVDPDLALIKNHLYGVEVDSMGTDSIFYWPTIRTEE
jgi:hypothetical protein